MEKRDPSVAVPITMWMPSSKCSISKRKNTAAQYFLRPSPHRLAVEAGATQGWHRYIGEGGDVIGIDHFGALHTRAGVNARIRIYRGERLQTSTSLAGEKQCLMVQQYRR